jgi:hypothetical protein
VPPHDAALEQLEQATQSGEQPPRAEPPAVETPAVETPAVERPAEPFIPEEGATLDLVTSETFATETMAELCLEQGHEEEALAIYERLVAQRPGDAELAERMRALRAHLHPELQPPETAGEFLRWLAQRDTAEVRAEASADQPEERAEPERIEAEQIEAERIEAEPAQHESAASDAPAETARDAWAAGAWEGAFRPRDEPAPSLLDELRLADGSRATPTDLSFDRFFAGDQDTAAPSEQPTATRESAPAATESPTATSPAPESAAASEADDLAEFNAWLRGLRDS